MKMRRRRMAEVVEVETENIPRVISVLSTLLQRLSDHNDALLSSSPEHHRSSAFHGLSKPAISVRSYMERIFRYGNCSPSCFVVAYIYLDRFARRNGSVAALHSLNVHRMLITSVLTAVKFMDDIYYNNAYYAKVGGISLVEMNYLEVDFLFGVGFQLNVTPFIFNSYCSVLQREMYMESPPPPLPLHCFLIDNQDDSNTCQHQRQLAV